MASAQGPAGQGCTLVLGGGSGIGRSCAEALAEQGRSVVVADLRRPDELPAGSALFLEVDARDAEAVEAAAADAEERVAPLAGAVYAAGTARVTPLLDISPKEWELVVGVNLTGAFNMVRATGRRMSGRGRGAIVAISSIDSRTPVPGLGHYCASKAGVESLVRVAAAELGPRGVRVNAVAPGVVTTPPLQPLLDRPAVRDDFLEHIPLGRIGEPSEIAAAVCFLLSDEARYVTGQTLTVDGGMSLREHARILPVE
jgi:NAD(P)-dependent dehydrogenase (short-subunit alcohol dehydrogenase family)